MIFLLILLLLLVVFSLIFLIFHIATIFTGAPYLGLLPERMKHVVENARIKKGEKTLDLGSGDGRIVIAMARNGARAYGYELNPFLVLLSNWNIYRANLQGKAFIKWSNFWSVDLSDFDVITVYGVSYIMERLEKKLKKEAKKNSRIISISYSFKNWKPISKKDFIFIYKK